MDIALELCCLRVPHSNCQFYCNGHSWLTRQLIAAGIGFGLADNGFIRLDDSACAQQLADVLQSDNLRRILDPYANRCCSVLAVFEQCQLFAGEDSSSIGQYYVSINTGL